ncbi:MAG: leucine-rich repeat domain-containing protein [Oscillospiraceae bacterium]|nr:leucine-rich repeat domain-containing protein [Oscillospiraceae bacterium]
MTKKIIGTLAAALMLASLLSACSTDAPPAYITLRGEQISTEMTELDLNGMDLSNEEIVTLRYMVNLTSLLLAGNYISDLSPLAGLTNLTFLSLFENEISDLTPLTGLTNLATLMLDANQISDLTPLAGLYNLMFLGLESNQISDISPLAGLTNLAMMGLSDNSINDWSPVDHVAWVDGRP